MKAFISQAIAGQYFQQREDIFQRLRETIVDAAQDYRLENQRALGELKFDLLDFD